VREQLVSVIIPTYNRRESLGKVLDSLSEQTIPCDQYEVIVVDDGSSVDYSSIVMQRYPFMLTYYKQCNQGATVARNCGASQASGDILLFLDDDISVVPVFLDTLVQAHNCFDSVLLMGNLQCAVCSDMSVFQNVYSRETESPPCKDDKDLEEVQFTDCLTGMFSIKRDHFFTIGMLQDIAGDGRVAWGDVDFGYRAYKLGFKFYRCRKAVGFHDDFSIRDLSTCAKRWQRTSQSAVKLLHTYPEIQKHLPMFKDKCPISLSSDPPMLIVRKILRMIASTRLVLYVLEQIIKLLEYLYPSPKFLAPLYRWVLGGYIYQGFRTGLHEYGLIKAYE